MDIETRNKKMAEIFEGCLGLSKRKGKDYAGAKDSMANLRVFGFKGILIRLFDKLYRLKNIEESGKIEVLDESVDDTLKDIIIYSALAKIMLHEKDSVTEQNTLMLSEQEVEDYGIAGDIEVVDTGRCDSEDSGDMFDEKVGK